MSFAVCSELPGAAELESDRICNNFIPDPKVVHGHYEEFGAVQQAVAAGTRDVRYQEPPPSIELKRYYNGDTQIPSPSEVKRLATDVYHDGSEEECAIIAAWFAQRRLLLLLKQEEKTKAALKAAKSGAIAVEVTVERIVDARAAAIATTRSEVGLFERRRALLKHTGTVSAGGSKDDMARRIYDMREYIITNKEYKIDESSVNPPDSAVEEQQRYRCATCGTSESSVANPFLECAAHGPGTGCARRARRAASR
mmetsp:Transcript_36444/g.81782  ORF Transcript_36444/g.81782 Transcript_36444/m.81782 type:complete len:254 (+) Transcript_36444:973-1734(+)